MVKTVRASVFPYRDGWLAVINYRDHANKRRQTRRSARTRTEANARAVELEAAYKARLLADMTEPPSVAETTNESTLTVADYIDEWLERRGRATLNGKRVPRNSTLTRYAHALDPVRKEIGDVSFAELNETHIERVYDSIRERGRSNGTLAATHVTFRSAILDELKRRDPRIPDDPFRYVTNGPHKIDDADNKRHMDEAIERLGRGIDALLTEADATSIGPLVRFLTWTGVRLGEALALTWDDVKADEIVIRRSLNHDGDVNPTKTGNLRRIPMAVIVSNLLDGIREAQNAEKLLAPSGSKGSLYQDKGFVFANALGHPLSQSGVGKLWGDIRGKAGVDRIRLHDLRHYFASTLLKAGRPITEVSNRLGHKTPQVTLSVYAHWIEHDSEKADDPVDVLFGAK